MEIYSEFDLMEVGWHDGRMFQSTQDRAQRQGLS